jgi:hypothetical protein
VKREENSGIIGVQRVRSPMPPCTMISVGPEPAHSSAMRLPSFDGTLVTCGSVAGRGADGVEGGDGADADTGEGGVAGGCALAHPTKTTKDNASEERDILEASRPGE